MGIFGYRIIGMISTLVFFLMFVRVARKFYKLPMPSFMANLIDNPLGHRIQPPDGMTHRHVIEPGMTVPKVGPGNGTYR